MCHHIWARGAWHTSHRADYGNLQASLSTLSAFNPNQPSNSFSPSKEHKQNTEKHQYPWNGQKIALLTDTNVRMSRVCTYGFSLPWLFFSSTRLRPKRGALPPITHMHICKECSECKELYTKFQEHFESCSLKSARRWWKKHIPYILNVYTLHNKYTVHTNRW